MGMILVSLLDGDIQKASKLFNWLKIFKPRSQFITAIGAKINSLRESQRENMFAEDHVGNHDEVSLRNSNVCIEHPCVLRET